MLPPFHFSCIPATCEEDIPVTSGWLIVRKNDGIMADAYCVIVNILIGLLEYLLTILPCLTPDDFTHRKVKSSVIRLSFKIEYGTSGHIAT